MANPQKENGYTSIANEILEHLAMMRINGEARQVLDVILRKTYGFGKKADKISLSQFCLYTKRSKPAVIRAIRKLQTYNLIIIKKDNDINIYQFNKDFDSWTPLSKKIITYMKKQTLKEYCYICGFKEALEQHHIIPISEGGQDKMSNKINLCPNCHTLAHRGKYSSDFLFIKKDNQENIIKKDNSDLQFVKKGLSKKIHTIDNTTKETITKEKGFVFFENKDFKELWENYLEMRKKIRKPATRKAEELILKKLHKHRYEIAVAMVEKSIENSWQGVFELRPEESEAIMRKVEIVKNAQKPDLPKLTDEQVKRNKSAIAKVRASLADKFSFKQS